IHSVSWERRTPNTFTDPEKLIEELRNISKQGYALDLEEFMEGMVAIAVPVIDSKGNFSGALAIHGPSVRLSRDNLLASKDILIDGANRLQKLTFELNDDQVE
ncbi:MAG: IclR family transcriptional regulator C-terminal domain-containing protein, partial [Nitratireductor sp.]